MQHPEAGYVLAEIASTFLPPLKRVQRVLGYFAVSAVFIHAAPYNVEHPWLIAAGVGLLGGASQSARIGQIALLYFAMLAIVPDRLITSIASALGL
ncbi:hypothetical protein GA0061105_10820 [Rhizobium aethiopicum]|uniref:Uncharacterized protein n=1 Tax=Rhizobium aethiopicum TaxID=1138170 RepID=A0A1C3Y5B3_9HYPH|nr:hypothetical protein [Rhizobium aethiopicum]SCB59664.1 hypothetical protein GA0061105_10820 [Rhizobium aethiopicum]